METFFDINSNGFFKIILPEYLKERDSSGNWDLSKELSDDIEKFFAESKNYTFLMTVANPEAVANLFNYVKIPEGEDINKEGVVREKRQSDKPDRDVGSQCKPVYFGKSLMREYLSTLKELTKKYIGNKQQISYPLVNISTNGAHSPNQEIHWPQIHIIKGNHTEEFKDLVGKLNDDEAYEILKKMEGTQKYQMGEIDTLHNNQINPLILRPEEWKVDGETLMNAVNFLIQFNLTYKSNSSSYDDY